MVNNTSSIDASNFCMVGLSINEAFRFNQLQMYIGKPVNRSFGSKQLKVGSRSTSCQLNSALTR